MFDQCRITGLIDPMSRAWFRALPTRDSLIIPDAEYVWLICTRLGLQQPSCIGLPPECTCKAGKGTSIDPYGSHTRWCKKGGGPTKVHDILRDTIHAMCSNAGVVAETETEGLMSNNQRPGDVVIHKPTAKDETWAVESPLLTTFPPHNGGATNSATNCATAPDSQHVPLRTASVTRSTTVTGWRTAFGQKGYNSTLWDLTPWARQALRGATYSKSYLAPHTYAASMTRRRSKTDGGPALAWPLLNMEHA